MTGFGLLVLPTVQTDAWILTCLHLIRAKAICYPLWHQMKNFTGYGGPYVNMTSANQSKLRGYMYFNGYNFFNIYTTFAYFLIFVKIVLFQKQRCLDLIIICMWDCIHCFVKVNRFQTYSYLFMFGYKHIKYKHFYICTALETFTDHLSCQRNSGGNWITETIVKVQLQVTKFSIQKQSQSRTCLSLNNGENLNNASLMPNLFISQSRWGL